MTLQVANTILEQIGGRGFLIMTGAKHLTGSPDSLSFRLPGSGGFCKDGINAVRVTLTPADTYTVTFSRIRGTKVTTVATVADVYAEDLQNVFTERTGLIVQVPRFRAA